jgi:tRNA nucleotidyltransferase (CCA-adding enzyme)
VKHISGPRLRRELSLLFQEPSAVDGTLMAQRMGVLQAIHPALGVTEAVAGRWREGMGRQAHGHTGMGRIAFDELGFCVVAAPKDEGTAASVSKWLHLAGRIEKALQDLVRLRAVSPKLAGASPSQTVELLDGYAPAAVQALGVVEGGESAATCEAYLSTWRNTKPALDGDALVAMGMAPGPILGDLLRRLRTERLEGRITTREQEIEVVRRTIAGAEGSGKR